MPVVPLNSVSAAILACQAILGAQSGSASPYCHGITCVRKYRHASGIYSPRSGKNHAKFGLVSLLDGSKGCAAVLYHKKGYMRVGNAKEPGHYAGWRMSHAMSKVGKV